MKTRKNEVKMALERLYLLRLPRALIGGVIHEFEKWVEHNGIYWACARIKSLKVDYIRYMNGEPPMSGVRRKRGTLLPKGVFSKLYKLGKPREVLNLLNLYTRFNHPVTQKDIDDANAAIRFDPMADLCSSAYVDLISTNHKEITKQLGYNPPLSPTDKFKYSTISDYYMNILHRHVSATYSCSHRLGELTPFLLTEHKSSAPRISPLVNIYAFIPNPKGSAQVYRSYQYNRHKQLHGLEDEIMMWKLNKRLVIDLIPEPVMKELEMGIQPMAIRGDFGVKNQYYSGELNFVAAKGKVRHVAAPYRFNQHLVRPLGRFIYSFLRNKENCPWDCTFDQNKPIADIRQWLTLGQNVWCFDLKKATDSIPLKFQIKLLKMLVDPRDSWQIKLWEKISQGVWSWRERPGEYAQWVTGQPLGLYPSFGAFALFHGMMLKSLDAEIRYSGVLVPQDTFWVLGDDVIIKTKALAEKYRTMLRALNIPISENKSLTHGTIGEFAGKIITKSGVYEPVNWDFHPDNIIDIGFWLNDKVLKYLSKESRELLSLVGDLPYPYGCNWFSSIPYNEKVRIVEELKSSLSGADGDNPEVQFRSYLNEITANMLSVEGITCLQSRILENLDNRVGFSYSRLSRDVPDKLFGYASKLNPLNEKGRNSFNQLGWLRLHKDRLQTLRKVHKLEPVNK